MHFSVFHIHNDGVCDPEIIRILTAADPASPVFFRRIRDTSASSSVANHILLPRQWAMSGDPQPADLLFYDDENPFSVLCSFVNTGDEAAMHLSNGRFCAEPEPRILKEILRELPWDVLCLSVDPGLNAFREQVKQGPDLKILGFRRRYAPTAEPAEVPKEWPHHLWIKQQAWKELIQSHPDGSFSSISDGCRKKDLLIRAVSIGGRVLDWFSEKGILALLEYSRGRFRLPGRNGQDALHGRRIGNVRIGRNVQIGAGAVIAAPAILCDGVEIGSGAVVRNVLLGPETRVAEKSPVQSQCIFKPAVQAESLQSVVSLHEEAGMESPFPFRLWPSFSYAHFGKRIFDILISGIFLVLFLPFFPVIALIIKLTSPGPVFYRARRQGLHGREFDCLKFRTMMPQAESMQEQLRIANQVDGPQFKIEEDPRISGVGKFLRDTCIDELPQFFNVLLGQMGIVGPRPSPESENEACPEWRDARLSIRPGITGLWQVSRTRQAGMDFQEWIYYDTQYVQNLSLGLDVRICLKTAQKLFVQFFDQF